MHAMRLARRGNGDHLPSLGGPEGNGEF